MQDRIEVIRGDITQLEADAIVNAANSSLMGGGGVDGAIHRKGGPAILEQCKQIVARQGGCKTGEAVITTAGDLPARYVIHTVGPVWNGGQREEREKLANCYRRSLELATEYNCESIAFPNISTGVYRFPKDEAALISITAIHEFILQNKAPGKVFIVCYDEENYRLVSDHLRNRLRPD